MRINKLLQQGRSMIEMLGVLAIIGVLSVGGIAGFSKAMEKFKLTKLLEEYSYMLFGVVEHLDDLRRNTLTSSATGIVDWVQGSQLVPEAWEKINTRAMNDNAGNIVQWYTNRCGYSSGTCLLVDFYLGGWTSLDSGKVSNAFSPKLCVEIFNSLAIPLSSSILTVNTYNSKKRDVVFYGSSYCRQGVTCLNDVTLTQIHTACEHCDGTGVCAITLRFVL